MQRRFDYRNWSFTVDPRNLVFVDEAGVNLAMTRLRGRAPQGERVHDSPPRNRGQNVSLLGALSMEGLVATMSVPGSVNTDVFVTYLREVLIPQLWVGAIVVMDNLSVHHTARVAELIEAAGAKLVFLPPYSPDLSPIELCWSKLKACLRSAKARTPQALQQALKQIVIQEISESNAIAWFAHYGLFA
ncbi:IS630 family transposase [Nodosilinea sp. FACHB-13]|uniref:IS630 family transposase n=1 Tax=Cyanophyceae TaxID=3028117 RepID=UPI001685E51C|nr:IS630 family transposase [Nodosilinea sp. FACHB-13]MBD2109333.1 IS630 family transposase [Nodosilinea sp. FACHB-13]